jgi:hypothetical protein
MTRRLGAAVMSTVHVLTVPRILCHKAAVYGAAV